LQLRTSSAYLSGLLFKIEDLVDGFLHIMLDIVNIVSCCHQRNQPLRALAPLG
jgi:hypothetical protein